MYVYVSGVRWGWKGMSEHGSTVITESHISILHVPFWSGGVVWPAPPPLAGVGLPYPAPNDRC